MVTLGNLEAYVAAVLDASVGSGVARQAAAFREGLQLVRGRGGRDALAWGPFPPLGGEG